jgi:serine/threonine protein kinase
VSQIQHSAVYCINPDCQSPYPQPWGNKFCNSCGATLLIVNRYVPLQRLGAGGFAQIYTVWDTKTKTEKVLKVLVEPSPKAQELFSQEAAVLSSWHHPGIPKVEADGYFQVKLAHPQPRQLHCLVMEKIEGQTLEQLQTKYPQGCPQDLILNWLIQTLNILEDLHRQKIVHRDIKPSNIMLRHPSQSALPENQLVLIDFGGAKQMSGGIFASPSNSTRLFSSGYSPPEQIRGAAVTPPADFYALGRTMIELLTGKYPGDLEDPMTGQLKWRQVVNVSPQLADLLDEMIQDDVRARPANTEIIKKRLTKITQKSQTPSILSQFKQTVGQAKTNLTETGDKVSNFFVKIVYGIGKIISQIMDGIVNTILFTLSTIFQALKACVDIIWTMILAFMGACVGTVTGYFLAYKTTVGVEIAGLVSQLLPAGSIPHSRVVFASQILLFAIAGLGTSWGLTLAGGFGQKRRYLIGSTMGVIGYSLGWLVLQLITPSGVGEGLVALILISVSLLTLGLGLKSHHIVHSFMAAFGTAIVFAGAITLLQFSPATFFLDHAPNWKDLPLLMGFFGFLGVFISFWLGVSNYVVVPWLRLLGWR